MIISIASGKGGTGKTTVATSLALSIDQEVLLLDCDVEEPNAHLFIHPPMNASESVSLTVPEIDEGKCSFCRKCSDICRFNAIAIFKKTVMTFPGLCHSCGGCFIVCPEKAIREGKREIGIIESGTMNGIRLVHGKLKIGEAMSPPLIRRVRAYENAEILTIIDAPPGTSCPVIHAIKGTDFVLLVSEPTPFGLHDLQLASEVVKALDIPCGLVINRSDIGDDRVTAFADREKIPVLLEIPFSREIAAACSKGIPLVETWPEWKKSFALLHRRINSIVVKRRRAA
jgi:MinD superfamily P-loop ATPase